MKTFYQYLQEQTPQQQNQQVKPGTQPNQQNQNQQVKPGTQPNQQNQNQQVKPGTQPNQQNKPPVDIKKLTDTFNALKQLLGPLGIK